MKKIKLLSFVDFVNESKISIKTPKVQIIKYKGVMSSSDNSRYLKFVDSITESFYEIFSVKKDGTKIEFDLDRPIVNYSLSFGEIFPDMNLEKNQFYNDFEEMEKSADKVKFHQTLKDKKYLPKTVFSIEETKKLKYPIIAKPAEGQSGVGIEKFEKYEDLEKSKYRFDLYSECIKDSREFRGMFCDGKIVAITERIADSKLNKIVGKKNPEEKIKFIYIEQNLKELPFINEIKEISSDVFKSIKLDVCSMDFFYNESTKDIKIIELNAATGFIPPLASRLYESIYKMHYKKDLDESVCNEIENICKKYCDMIIDDYPEEFEKSFKPLTFK